MAVKTVTRKRFQLTCEVCGHKWESGQKPLRCAGCKTPYWDRKRDKKAIATYLRQHADSQAGVRAREKERVAEW